MFPFQISSSFFETEDTIPEMSSSSTSTEFASTGSDSDSSISTISAHSELSVPKISCFFDPSTCKRQSFSIPEKILYYMAKNVTNAETFQKLVETCKYFYQVNPVIVAQQLSCSYDGRWYVYDQVDGKCRVEFKYDQPLSFKIWITQKFLCFFHNASQYIPSIYKNDATVVELRTEPLKVEEFLIFAGNAKELTMLGLLIKYEDGKTVQLEDIVKNLPKLKSLTFQSNGGDVNSNTAKKLMEIEHFKHISQMKLSQLSEALDVADMFNLILENKDIEIKVFYRTDNSDAYKQRVQEYSNLLKEENGCSSGIGFSCVFDLNKYVTPSSEDDSSDTSFVSIDDVSGGNEDLMFPWNNEEEWELPWDKTE